LPVPPEVTPCEALSHPIGIETRRDGLAIDLLLCIIRSLFTSSECRDASFMFDFAEATMIFFVFEDYGGDVMTFAC
jgi:hypothetical protein